MAILLLAFSLTAQSLSNDLLRLERNAATAGEVGSEQNNPGLDTIIATLAYYAAAPDLDKADQLASGPGVMNHYKGNSSIMEFLNQQGLDTMLWNYYDYAATDFSWLVEDDRTNFLRKPNTTELFSRNGLVDVNKIHAAYSAPLPPQETALKRAANDAKTPDLGVPSANYVGIALAGLSDWIGRRAQEELSYTFLNRLRDKLHEDKLEYLFPHTVAYLPTLNLINYKAILPSIRLAFAQDLNQVSLSLGEYLNATDQDNYNDPAVYNLFLLYRLLDLGARDVPLSDILAFTYGQLADSRLNTRRAIDLKLAEAAKTAPEFGTLITTYRRFASELNQLEAAFQQAKNDLLGMEGDLAAAFSDDAADQIADKIDAVANFNYRNLLFDDDKAPAMVTAWLEGKEAYDYYLANPTISQYDQLFDPNRDTLSEVSLRAAGLTALREILSRKEQLRDRYVDLVVARNAIDSLRAILEVPNAPDNAVAFKRIIAERILQERLYFLGSTNPADTIQLRFLGNLLEEVVEPDPEEALPQIRAISERLDAFSEQRQEASPNYLRLHPPSREKEMYGKLVKRIEIAEADFLQLQLALEGYSTKEADQLVRGHRNAANFETIFGLGKELFFLLYDKQEERQKPLLPTTSIASMKSNEKMTRPQSFFAETGTMTSFMLAPQSNLLVRGLASERLAQVPGLGGIDPTGVSKLVMDFTEQLAQLRSPSLRVENGDNKERTEGRIRMVNFITTTISTLVQAPIFVNQQNASQPLNLMSRFPGFQKIPAINANLNDLFRLSQTGQFRYSITNLLNLIDLFNVIPPGNKRQVRLMAEKERLENTLADLQGQQLGNQRYDGLALNATVPLQIDENLLKAELADVSNRLTRLDTSRVNRNRQQLFLYGTFMADVAAADSPDAFAAALNNVALPPGSSQLKRNKPFSLEVNAYFGAAVGNEVLDLPETAPMGVQLPKAESRTLALFVPVGLSMSWKTSFQQKSSYSLFFPLIDLGAVSAYRFDTANDQIERLPRFTFQNVFAPGAHLMYNFARTPFTLGVGAQYGPNNRRIQPEGAPFYEVSGIRYMITFSVDVPIFSFTNRP